MAVAVLVVAGHDLGQRGLDVGEGALVLRQRRGVLDEIEHGAGVAVGGRGQKVEHLVLKRDGKGGRAALAEFEQFRAAKLPQTQHVQP